MPQFNRLFAAEKQGGCKYICDDENGRPVESQPKAKPRGRRVA